MFATTKYKSHRIELKTFSVTELVPWTGALVTEVKRGTKRRASIDY